MDNNIVEEFHDLFNIKSLSDWIEARLQEIRNESDWKLAEPQTAFTEYASDPPTGPLGRYEDPIWRKFVLAALLADWACYTDPAERVDFSRLLFLMHTFPAGFRIWWATSSKGIRYPVGYTGWYPVSHQAFNLLTEHLSQVQTRFVAPLSKFKAGDDIYLYNYSIIPQLKKTELSKALIKRYADDVLKLNVGRLAAIAVSSDGARIAKRFGMNKIGEITVGESVEDVYARV